MQTYGRTHRLTKLAKANILEDTPSERDSPIYIYRRTGGADLGGSRLV